LKKSRQLRISLIGGGGVGIGASVGLITTPIHEICHLLVGKYVCGWETIELNLWDHYAHSSSAFTSTPKIFFEGIAGGLGQGLALVGIWYLVRKLLPEFF